MKLFDALLDAHRLNSSDDRTQFDRRDLRSAVFLEKSSSNFTDRFHTPAGTDAKLDLLSTKLSLETLARDVHIAVDQLIESAVARAALLQNTQQPYAAHRITVCGNNACAGREADFD